jgi:hypothetical protein
MGYLPILGRFLQRDPVTFIDGPNPYEMNLSNPVNRLDPDGNASLGWVAGTPAPDPGWQNNYTTINGPIAGYLSGAVNKDSGALAGVAFDQFQFGPDALQYISDNVNISAIT